MKKNYFIGLFLIVTTLLFTMGSSVEANNQIENGFQTNNILTEFKLKNNLWYSGNQINNLNSILDRLTSNLELQQSNTSNIKAELSPVTPTSGPNGSEIEVTYTITPEESFDAPLLTTSKDKDILFIIDTSISTNNNRLTEFKNALQNVFADYGSFAQRENKVGVILYGDTVSSEFINPYKPDQNGYLQNYQGLLQPVFGNINNTNSSDRKLGKALEEAIKYFNGQLPEPNKPNNSDAEKYIVLFAGDKPTDTISKNMLSGYNLITLAVNNIDNVKELHTYLGGNEAYFYANTADNGSGMDKPATEIRDLILSGIFSKPFTVDAPLNFDLGEDFESIDDNLISTGGTSYQLKVPTITYTPVTKNDDGTYRYEADEKEIKVSFKIKVNTEKTGTITFANTDDVNSNNLTYTDLNGKTIKDLIETPTFEVTGTSAGDSAPSTYTNDAIKILEIQPADSFTLTGSSDLGKIKTGTEDCTINVDDIEYEVSITHMSMPEFIGKAEKIDGKYDVIVLGRYVDSSITNSNDELNQYRYRDYYYDRGNNNEENDITVRKANELIEFMNKNQLVYIDSNIINNTTNSNSDYMKTNLYKIFSDNQNRSQKNVKTNFTTSKDSGNSIVTLQQVIRDYISLDTKEKGFAITLIDPVPNDITTDDINAVDGKAENRNRYLDLTVKNADNSKENVTLNLYLDLNGDGLYSEDEIAVSRNHLSLPLENYELNFSVHPDFIGLLEWKLEVIREDTNQTKTYLTGSNFFHRLTEEKKKINVLQITAQSNYATVDGEGNTESNKDYQVLNLKSNDDFTNLLSTVELKDYDITIDIIHYEQYIKYLNSLDDELDEYELKIKYLNGYYDMVICGFQDVYGRNAFGGENNQLVDFLIEFVRTGQGLMLTHDTIEKNDTPSMFNTFRVFTGQSRYPTLSNGEIVNDFNGATISYDLNIRGNNTNGFTIWGLMGDSEGATNSMSTGVYRTNNALITSYPYVLSDEEEEGLLRIRRTHGQYYQLNLEDEEVIPWYSFSANNKGENGGRRPQFNTWINSVNPYDVRNNYYTYSKGNITFSGTGEQRREYIHYPKSELKLFVNTIIKAERGANHRPTVEVQNIESGQQISLSQNKIEFNVIPRDIDLDLMDVTVEVSACKNNKCSVVGTPIVYEDRKDNESFQVTLNQDFLSQVEKDANQLKIKVYAVDEHQAKSEEVIKTLEIVDLDLLTVSLYPQDGNTRFLVGDTISLVADFSKSENYKNDYIELNYNLNSIPSYLTLSGESSRNLGTLTSESIQTVYELTVQADSAFSTSTISSTKVGGESRYCINSCSTVIAGTQSSPLEIKKGQIRIKLISEQFSEQLSQVSLKIENQSGGMWTVTPNSAGEFIVDNVPTGSYSLTVELPDGLKTFEVIQQNGDEGQVVDLTTPLQFDINFENNLFEANFTFIEPQTDINHGLYGGLDESNNQFEIIPSEITQSGEDLRKEFVGGSIVNFAGTFTYKSPLQSIQLLVDKKLNVSKENIKAYEILTIESGLELKEIENVDIYVARQKSEDLIMFNFINRISANTPVLIHYSVTVPDINDGIYTNTLKVGTKEKLTSIKSIKQIDENSSENLPYLF